MFASILIPCSTATVTQFYAGQQCLLLSCSTLCPRAGTALSAIPQCLCIKYQTPSRVFSLGFAKEADWNSHDHKCVRHTLIHCTHVRHNPPQVCQTYSVYTCQTQTSTIMSEIQCAHLSQTTTSVSDIQCTHLSNTNQKYARQGTHL